MLSKDRHCIFLWGRSSEVNVGSWSFLGYIQGIVGPKRLKSTRTFISIFTSAIHKRKGSHTGSTCHSVVKTSSLHQCLLILNNAFTLTVQWGKTNIHYNTQFQNTRVIKSLICATLWSNVNSNQNHTLPVKSILFSKLALREHYISISNKFCSFKLSTRILKESIKVLTSTTVSWAQEVTIFHNNHVFTVLKRSFFVFKCYNRVPGATFFFG